MTIDDYVPGPELRRWMAEHEDGDFGKCDRHGFPQAAMDEVCDIVSRDVDAWAARHRHELVVRPSEQPFLVDLPEDEDPISMELAYLEYGVLGSVTMPMIGFVEMAPRDIELALQGFEKPMSDN